MNALLTHPTATPAHVLAVALCPILFLAFALVLTPATVRSNRLLAFIARKISMGVFALAVIAAAGRFIAGPFAVSLGGEGLVSIDLYFDSLTAVMLVLVSFLGMIVTRYAGTYLDGDPRQGRFFKWLCVTIGSVLTLIISGNLLLFTLAWTATSIALHKLLIFYPERPAAMLAAWKKFFISRLGDACLIGALVLTWNCFGTLKFTEIFAAVDSLRASGTQADCLTWSSVLLVFGALLKSAQFPFHSWLPDTMETPTPVSALMHAGIINAGGFLVVRLSPIISSTPMALNALALVGAFTAIFASIVMLTQTSVKRALAYSTIAQMGFMMLQCGLGAFALAVLHIVAHSLYKAHAFLSSGNVVRISKSAWVPSERPVQHPVILVGTLATAVAMTWLGSAVFGVSVTKNAGGLLLGAVYTMALAYLLWNLWASSHRAGLIGWGMLIGAGATTAYFSLHWAAEKLLGSSLAQYSPVRSPLEYGVMIAVLLLFMGVLIFQSQIPSWSATKLGQALYVHASQGFYLGTFANRLTASLLIKAGASHLVSNSQTASHS